MQSDLADFLTLAKELKLNGLAQNKGESEKLSSMNQEKCDSMNDIFLSNIETDIKSHLEAFEASVDIDIAEWNSGCNLSKIKIME